MGVADERERHERLARDFASIRHSPRRPTSLPAITPTPPRRHSMLRPITRRIAATSVAAAGRRDAEFYASLNIAVAACRREYAPRRLMRFSRERSRVIRFAAPAAPLAPRYLPMARRSASPPSVNISILLGIRHGTWPATRAAG